MILELKEINMKNGLIINEWKTKIYYLNDKFHREDGPAVENTVGNKFWYINDLLHREDGPACEYGDKSEPESYYLNGKNFSKENYWKEIERRKSINYILSNFKTEIFPEGLERENEELKKENEELKKEIANVKEEAQNSNSYLENIKKILNNIIKELRLDPGADPDSEYNSGLDVGYSVARGHIKDALNSYMDEEYMEMISNDD